MGKTPIGWTDDVWNCIRGCTEVSPGCAHCYAREQAARIVRMDVARRAADPSCKSGSYDRVVQIHNGKARWTDVVEKEFGGGGGDHQDEPEDDEA